ncbi:MAG TPA: hypothetical protein VK480_06585 [Solirubrobacterales bacterium]|nr:hypothetical protein [Solirubrobacterales bacterium]
MRKLHLLLIPVLLLVPVLALSACGGGESDEDQVVETIETSILSEDPADCERLATLQFLEQTQFTEGQGAVESCEEDAKDDEGDADSVDVTNVEVDGSNATADAAFGGGTFDGQTFSVALIEEDGDWKLNEITGFAEFDGDRLAETFEEEFKSESGADPKVASCIGDQFRELGQSEFEAFILGGETQPLAEIFEACE